MHRHEHDAGDQTADVPAHWPPPDNDSDDDGAAVRLPDREPPRAHNAAASGITRPAAARLWFHLDEVRPGLGSLDYATMLHEMDRLHMPIHRSCWSICRMPKRMMQRRRMLER